MSFRAPHSKQSRGGLWAGLAVTVALMAAIAPTACTSPSRDFGVDGQTTGSGGATATGPSTASGTASQGTGGMTTSTGNGGATSSATTGSGGGDLTGIGKPCSDGAMCASTF